MNAQLSVEYIDQVEGIQHDFTAGIIRKVDLLREYRETKQTFLNLGSVLINQDDGTFYIFNSNGDLVRTAHI